MIPMGSRLFISPGQKEVKTQTKNIRKVGTIPIPSMYGIFTYIWLIFMVNAGKYTNIPYCMDGTGYETIKTSSREGSGFSLMPKISCSGWVLEAISWSSSINALGSVQDRMGRAVGCIFSIGYIEFHFKRPQVRNQINQHVGVDSNLRKTHEFSKSDIKCAKRIWQVVLQVYIFA